MCICENMVYIVRYYKVFMYIFVYERDHLAYNISDVSEYSFFLLDHDTHQSPPDLHKSLILPNIQPQQTLPIFISMPILPSPFLIPCILPLYNLCPKFRMMIIHTKLAFVIFDKSMHFRHWYIIHFYITARTPSKTYSLKWYILQYYDALSVGIYLL